jgi:hypothetical protein
MVLYTLFEVLETIQHENLQQIKIYVEDPK